MGPYHFLERREKVNITFHPENRTVSFLQKRLWYFDENNSNGTLQDNITQLNIIAVTAAHKVRYSSDESILSFFLSVSSSIHITKTVDELLFNGYSDFLIDLGHLAAKTDVPNMDKFGWFYQRNGSASFDGHYNMATGQEDMKNMGKIKQWDYKNTTPYAKSPCNAVEGSAGEIWPPSRDKGEINLFSSDLCRMISLEYNRTVSHLGIEGYQYSIGDKTLSNNTKRLYPHKQTKDFDAFSTNEEFFNAEHSNTRSSSNRVEQEVVNVGQCFCNGECMPSGLLNLSACFESPIFMSLPHFFKADPIYRDQVTGMDPKEEDHDFYITLEPTTGIPLEVAVRVQINILLQPSETMGFFMDVPKVIFPILWFDEYVSPPEDLACSIKQLLLLPIVELYMSLAMIFLGVLILLYVGIQIIVKRNQQTIEDAKPDNLIPSKREMEQVYLDTLMPNDCTHSRGNRRLYPKRSSNCQC